MMYVHAPRHEIFLVSLQWEGASDGVCGGSVGRLVFGCASNRPPARRCRRGVARASVGSAAAEDGGAAGGESRSGSGRADRAALDDAGPCRVDADARAVLAHDVVLERVARVRATTVALRRVVTGDGRLHPDTRSRRTGFEVRERGVPRAARRGRRHPPRASRRPRSRRSPRRGCAAARRTRRRGRP